MGDSVLIKGEFYNTLVEKREDSEELKNCMEQTVQKLLENETHINMNHRILKHSGYTYSVEEIHDRLKKVIEGDENI